MSPQKGNGYTAIANEIMEALSKYRIPGEQMQCLLFIIRKTYGYNKKTDSISLSQFVDSTGIKRPNVARAIKALILKNIIYVKKGGIKKDTISISKYTFNKRYKSWLSGIKKDTGGINTVVKVVSKKIHTKETLTKEKTLPHKNAEPFYLTKKKRKLTGKHLESFELFWKYFNYKKDKASAADSWFDIDNLTGRLANKIFKSAKAEASNRQDLIDKGMTPIYAQGWITARRWEDEIEPLNGNDPDKKETQTDINNELKEALS